MKKNKEPQKNVAHQHVSNESTRRREEGAETLFKDKRQKKLLTFTEKQHTHLGRSIHNKFQIQ